MIRISKLLTPVGVSQRNSKYHTGRTQKQRSSHGLFVPGALPSMITSIERLGLNMVSYIAYKDKLKGAYLQAFDFVETYSAMLEVPEQETEDMLSNLLDSLYQAQENEQPVEKIMGTDLEHFCREYFQDYTYIGNFLRAFIPSFYRLAIIIFLFSFLDLMTREEHVTLLHATIDVGGYVCGGLGGIASGILTSAVAKVILLRMKKFTNKIYTFITISLFVCCMVIAVILCEDLVITVPGFLVLLVSGAYIALYKLMQWTKRYKQYGTIKKSAENSYSLKETLKELWRSETEESRYETLENLIKGYQRKNARLIKRGKEEISPWEHTEQIRKSAKTGKYDLAFYVFLFLICVGGGVWAAEFDSVLDFVICLLLMVVVEGAVMRFCYKCSRAVSDEIGQLLACCDEEGITLLELWERYKAGKEEKKDV